MCCKIYYHCDLYYDSLQIWINMLLYKYIVNLVSSIKYLFQLDEIKLMSEVYGH